MFVPWYICGTEDNLQVGSLLLPRVDLKLSVLGEATGQAGRFSNPLSEHLKDPMSQEIVLWMREHLRHLADECGGLEPLPFAPRLHCPHILLLSTSITRKTLPARFGNSITVPSPLLATILRVRCKMAVAKNEQKKNSMFSLL